jgi:hypothetical protein
VLARLPPDNAAALTEPILLSRFSPYIIGFPPIKQPLALEAEALASGCPRKMGQKKEIFFMSSLIVSWNRSGKVFRSWNSAA